MVIPFTQVWIPNVDLRVFLVPGPSLLAHLGNFGGKGPSPWGALQKELAMVAAILTVAILKTDLADGGLCGILSFQGFH